MAVEPNGYYGNPFRCGNYGIFGNKSTFRLVTVLVTFLSISHFV